MLRRTLLGTSIIVSVTSLSGTAALADITAADVWANNVAYYTATGATVQGTPRTDGDAVVIDGASLLYNLPMGAGSFTVSLPPLRLIENADGTVTLADTGDFDITLSATIGQEGPVSATIAFSQTGYVASASGTPGDITYSYAADSFTMTLADLVIPDAEVNFDMSATGQGYSATVHVTEGDLITTTSDAKMGPLAFDYTVSAGPDFSTTSKGEYLGSESTTNMALVAGGFDILNLTPAFEQGMLFSFVSKGEGNTASSSTLASGQLLSEQTTSAGPSTANFVIDKAGLDLGFVAESLAIMMNQPDLFPLPIEFSAAGAAAGYKFPVLASPDAQPFGFNLMLKDMTVTDEIWNIIDAGKTLPRDPISIDIDLAGTVISGVNLFDVFALEQQFAGAVPPVSLESLKVSAFDAAALGATMDGSAELTFDNTDLETYAGLPLPVGDVYVAVTGANALLDRLEAMGLLTPDDISGARMGMAFVGRATGDDSFETVVEFGADKSMSVNGQRMR